MSEKIIKNPILELVKTSIKNTKNQLFLATPFITSYVRKVLSIENTNLIRNKKFITRFDDSNLLTFDIPTMEYLLELGFEIRYNNDIHLKLYITDSDTYVTSSNLTQSGFENKIELTVKVEDSNNEKCLDVFNDIWANSEGNIIDKKLLVDNRSKYNVLRRKQNNHEAKKPVTGITEYSITDDATSTIIQEILNLDKDYSETLTNVYEANKLRDVMLSKLKNGFKAEFFYLPKGDPKKNKTLFYDFVYGYESDLAGTGLIDSQFKEVAENPKFKEVIEFIYPEIIGLNPWNLEDKAELQIFCNGIFDFKIRSYKETLPIRLASYFYPRHFIPVFKLEHLKGICSDLGFNTKPINKGVALFEYNQFVFEQLKNLPYDTYIKSYILYLLHYTLELYRRIKSGENP